ncbi:hypothetical protein GB937_008074 [Aspergillus fischeri]|nr:hypothetical protein GB937_008074 [Aspergillus fischeri]
MSGPFIPIIPICFQCGTDQNPCRCKFVGPTLGMGSFQELFATRRLSFALRSKDCWLTVHSMLGYPVKLNGIVSDAIPI